MATLQDIAKMADMLQTKSIVCEPTRCVAVRNRNASCRNCVNACIADAITVDKNELAVDASACVACGACVAVCPTQALIPTDPLNEALEIEIAQAVNQAEGQAVFACARAASKQVADPEKFAVVPCLGRMDEELLVKLAAHGVTDIALVDGVCSTCKYGWTDPCIHDTVASAQSFLELMGSDACIERTSSFPAEVLAQDEGKLRGQARRGFLTQAGSYAKDVVSTAAEQAINEKLRELKLKDEEATLRQKLGVRAGAGKMPPLVPERNYSLMDSLTRLGEPAEDEFFTRVFGEVSIDGDACNGCGMCIMFCPTKALQVGLEEPADPSKHYIEFSAAECTQCNLCADICMKKCLEVSPVVRTSDLFDFEPRLIEVNAPERTNPVFSPRLK